MDLYIKGEIPKNYLGVAVVGSRKSTKRGEELAYKFSYALAKKGIVIISGLARGIDTIAHKAALDAGGKTLAVLGSGLNIIYPPENKRLAEEIIKNGALISPFAEDTPPHAENFKPRNGVVVELSACVVVIEGEQKSGTLNTARWAADSGKEVFALPGSPATDYLIQNGGSVAHSPEDIITYLGIEVNQFKVN